MERALCEKCGSGQPRDWQPGDLCTACGAGVRREMRCVWCTRWIPAGRFCRHCGCETVAPDLYGAARMLQQAGVDRFSISDRLRALDPEQVRTFTAIFEAQLAAISRRVEEVRLCERFLLQRGYAKRLEEELVPLLPLQEAELAELAAGPQGPFHERPDLLKSIAEQSPMPSTRQLAALALARQGIFGGDILSLWNSALHGKDPAIATEAALAAAHWRAQAHPYNLRLDPRRIAAVVSHMDPSSPLFPWAAAALAFTSELQVSETDPTQQAAAEAARSALCSGLASPDADLRFTCALALGDQTILSEALDDPDEHKSAFARAVLASWNSPFVERFLREGPGALRREVLYRLRSPLPDALAGAVLAAVEGGDEETRARGARLLQATLRRGAVERLVRVAQREKDQEIFRSLLGAEELPCAAEVVAAVIDSGLLEPVFGASTEAARHIDFSQDAVVRLAAAGGAQEVRRLVRLAGNKLSRMISTDPALPSVAGELRATGAFLAGIAFGTRPAEVRYEAYSELEQHDPRFWQWMEPECAAGFFGGETAMLTAIAATLDDPELYQISNRLIAKLRGCWEEFGPRWHVDRATLSKFANTLLHVICGPYGRDVDMQYGTSRVLLKMAELYPGEALPAVAALLRDRRALAGCGDVIAPLLDMYPRIGRRLSECPDALNDLVDALLQDLRDGGPYPGKPTALLLGRLGADYPDCRPRIHAAIAPMLEQSTYPPERECLENLARDIGFTPPPVASESEEVGADGPAFDPESLRELDHQELLPGLPFPTLAGYVRLLKNVNTASDMQEALRQQGIDVQQWLGCVTAWSDLVSRRDDLGARYGQLLAEDSESKYWR